MKLAAIDVGDGQEAAILRRDDGTVHWTPGRSGWYAVWSAPLLSLTPVPAGTLVSGELPPGATTVEVRGDVEARDTVVAGGLFLAVLPRAVRQDGVFVLFRDDGGAIVHPWRGEELKRTPIADADAACPACGGRSWDRVEWRAEPEAPTARTRAVACRTCGRVEGGVELVGRRRGEPEPPLEWEPSPLPEDASPADVVHAARFPVYTIVAPRLQERTLESYGGRSGQLEHVELQFKRGSDTNGTLAHVRSSSGDQRFAAERSRSMLIGHLRSRLWSAVIQEMRGSGHDAQRLRHRELVRPVEAAVSAAPVTRASLSIEGKPTEFAVVAYGEWWAAATDQIAIVCRNLAPDQIELAPLEPATEWATSGAP